LRGIDVDPSEDLGVHLRDAPRGVAQTLAVSVLPERFDEVAHSYMHLPLIKRSEPSVRETGVLGRLGGFELCSHRRSRRLIRWRQRLQMLPRMGASGSFEGAWRPLPFPLCIIRLEPLQPAKGAVAPLPRG